MKKQSLNDFFSNKEIITYKNINDLAKKIIKYSINNKLRRSIAKRGRNKYFKYFNSTVIAEYILNKSFGIRNKKYFWEN
jgi:spore maturation protein CgeB